MERILVAYDGSKQATKALEHATAQFPDATIVVLNVIDPAEASYSGDETGMLYTEGWYETASSNAENRLDDAREKLGDRPVETDHEVGKPARTILEYAEEHDIDHIVMGSQGRTGVSRLLLGSVAESVVRRSTVPVTVVR